MSKISPKRFPILDASDGQTVGEVGLAHGVTIAKGAAFYLLTKKESVSAQKRVVIRHKKTGELRTDAEARDTLGLKYASCLLCAARRRALGFVCRRAM